MTIGPGTRRHQDQVRDRAAQARQLRAQSREQGDSLSSAAGIAGTIFRVDGVEGDYLVCRSPDAPFDGEVTRVAKPWNLRRSLDEGTQGNITTTYETNVRKVVSSDSFPDETLLVTPPYSPQVHMIVALNVGPSTGVIIEAESEADEDVELSWIDMNIDARQWAELLFGT